MINTFNQFANNFLVAIENNDLIDIATVKESVSLLAQLLANEPATVTLCTTVNTEIPSSEDNPVAAQLLQLKNDVIEQGLTDCASVFGEKIESSTLLLHGKVFLAITREMIRGGYDALICIRSAHTAETGLSATELHLARKCPGPILFFDQQQRSKLENVVVAVDRDVYGGGNASALAKDLVKVATNLASVDGANLHIVHAWQPLGVELLGDPRLGFESQEIENYRAEQRASHDKWLKELVADSAASLNPTELTTSLHLKEGEPDEVVLAICEKTQSDLLVIGTVGITDVPGVLIGDVAETILGVAPCSMLAMKPEGFQTPIAT